MNNPLTTRIGIKMKKGLRLARNSKMPLGKNKEFDFAKKHALCAYRKNAIYTFIPKNACSTLRYSLGVENGIIHSADDISWIHSNNNTFSASLENIIKADYSFVVLRCPYTRLGSVFLDKIVSKNKKFWSKLKINIDDTISPKTFTFRHFVEAMSGNLLYADIHWTPQSHFLIYESYDRYFSVENFSTAIRQLNDDIGFKVLDARKLTGHGTEQLKRDSSKSFCDVTTEELNEIKTLGRVPAYSNFYDKDIMRKVQDLFGEDFNIFQKHVGDDKLILNKGT